MAFQRKELSTPRILDFRKGFLLKLKNALDAIFAPKVHEHTEYVKKTEVSSYVGVAAPNWSNQIAYWTRTDLVNKVTAPQDGFIKIMFSGTAGYENHVYLTINGVAVAQGGICVGSWRDDYIGIFPCKKGDVIGLSGTYSVFTIYGYYYSAR